MSEKIKLRKNTSEIYEVCLKDFRIASFYKAHVDFMLDNQNFMILNDLRASSSYNHIKFSIIMSLNMAMARIWDSFGLNRFSLPTLIKNIKNESTDQNSCKLLEIEELFRSAEDLREKLKHLRDRVYAHSLDIDPPDFLLADSLELYEKTEMIFKVLFIYINDASIGFVDDNIKSSAKQFWSFLLEGAELYKQEKEKRIKSLKR